MELVKTLHPQTYRKYKWAEIFRVELSKPSAIQLYTFDYGVSYLPPETFKNITLENNGICQLNNQIISRNDYMYTLSEAVSKVVGPSFEFYIEQVKFPGVDFFFGELLKTLKSRYVKPMTTYAVLCNNYFQLTETIKDGFSIPQAFRTYK